MEFNLENCLQLKDERRKNLKDLSIDEKIRIVENLRQRVSVIRNIRNNRANQSLKPTRNHAEASQQA
jgi:hypothetical protein